MLPFTYVIELRVVFSLEGGYENLSLIVLVIILKGAMLVLSIEKEYKNNE